MKIEKISENQIKFILSQTDLQERDIKVSELAYGSKKTQELFREMMETAMEECDFYTDSTPLMIEAIPMSGDSIVIIVTKVSSPEEFENKFNIPTTETCKTKNQSPPEIKNCDNISIFMFESLDNSIKAAERIFGLFKGDSALFKENNMYFLMLESENEILNLDELDAILSEYGYKYISTIISKQHIIEHGEPIIKNSAVDTLANL